METVFFDPTAEHSRLWRPHLGDANVLAAAVGAGGLPQQRIKMQLWDVAFMLNPLPHEVTQITAGDRLCFVGFIGFGK